MPLHAYVASPLPPGKSPLPTGNKAVEVSWTSKPRCILWHEGESISTSEIHHATPPSPATRAQCAKSSSKRVACSNLEGQLGPNQIKLGFHSLLHSLLHCIQQVVDVR